MSTPDDSDRTVTGPPAPAAPRPREDAVTGLMVERQRGRASAALQPGHTLPIGTRLRDYEITGLIGEGGFGIVYLAWDHSLQRKVAIKEYMPSSMAARVNGSSAIVVKSERHLDTFKAGLRSFVNEARLLARFDHPSLVKVYRFWEENGTAYMVMPYYEGPTLKTALAELGHVPSEAELRSWLTPLLNALTVMHAAQCYHRDIAPDNILLTPRGPLLLDFGAARRVIGDMTHAITVVLKPGYAPIEQYGDVASMAQGAWTDLYALACVVYYAITGKTPMSSVERLMDDRLEPLAVSAAGRYSQSFLRAIDRALAVRPGDRPQNEAQFRALLDADRGAMTAPIVETPAAPTPDRSEAEGADGAPGAAEVSQGVVVADTADAGDKTVPTPLIPELPTQLVPRLEPAEDDGARPWLSVDEATIATRPDRVEATPVADPVPAVEPPRRAAPPAPPAPLIASTSALEHRPTPTPSPQLPQVPQVPQAPRAPQARQTPRSPPVAPAPRTRSTMPIGLLLLGLALVAGIAAAIWWWPLGGPEPGPARSAEGAASMPATSASAATPLPPAATAASSAPAASAPASAALPVIAAPAASAPITAAPIASAPVTPAPAEPRPSIIAPPRSASVPVLPTPVERAAPVRARREPVAPRSEPGPEARPAPRSSSRCSDILQKASLEPLTADEASYLKRECR